MSAFCNLRIALLTGLAITLLGAFYIYQSPLPLEFSVPRPSSNNSVPGFAILLNQTSHNPPTLIVTLENHHSDADYTVLKWGTPIDPFALDTGVFSIVDDASHNEIEQEILHINRKVPPPPNQLITLAAGTQEEIEVVFNRPWMPGRKPTKYKVSAKGVFKGGWAKSGNELTKTDLLSYADSPLSGKRFVTNEIVMEVY
ncbi:hypothetical protein yc1106_05676 [Curvularia clavata]|uniref:Uncharacterized protein n=1 Tax=Curvularia clavata TaxID=95742 RepID=A0A9Q8Z8I0_CURCL|nr:hypothetical protein yc1106_05676 [Curvularia clavata]